MFNPQVVFIHWCFLDGFLFINFRIRYSEKSWILNSLRPTSKSNFSTPTNSKFNLSSHSHTKSLNFDSKDFRKRKPKSLVLLSRVLELFEKSKSIRTFRKETQRKDIIPILLFILPVKTNVLKGYMWTRIISRPICYFKIYNWVLLFETTLSKLNGNLLFSFKIRLFLLQCFWSPEILGAPNSRVFSKFISSGLQSLIW